MRVESSFHVRIVCIEKYLSWRDERLMRTFVWSLQVFDALCGYFSVVLGMNNIGDIIGRHVLQCYMNCEADYISFKILVCATIAVRC